MKLSCKVLVLIVMPLFSKAQINPLFIETTEKQADSLKVFLKQTNNDTLRMEAMRDLTLYYLDFSSDSSSKYILQELPLVEKLGLKLWKADAYDLYSIVLNNQGNYTKSLEFVNAARQIAEREDCEKDIWHIARFTNTGNSRNARLSMLAAIQLDMGGLYRSTQDYDKQLIIHRESLRTATIINDLTIITIVNLNLGNLYRNRKQHDSALYYYHLSIGNSAKCGYRKYLSAAYNGLAELYLRRQKFNLVQQYLDSAIKISVESRNLSEKASYYILMAQLFAERGKPDSAINYAYEGVTATKSSGQSQKIAIAYSVLANIYRMQNQYDSAFRYLELAGIIKDSVNSAEFIQTRFCRYKNKKTLRKIGEMKNEKFRRGCII